MNEFDNFPWYRVVPNTDPIQQGDFLNNFPIPIPKIDIDQLSKIGPSENPIIEVEGDIETYNIVVMTQSCDLEDYRDNNQVILCARYAIQDAKNLQGQSLNDANGWGNLIRDRLVFAHLVNKSDLENFEFEYQVIDLQRIFSVPLAVVKHIAVQHGPRVRLLPPYREHLSQAFARQFMRVGLPSPLPKKYPYTKMNP